MTWDIPQFRALVEGLCDINNWDHGADEFLILADAFQEANDERHKWLRRYIKAQEWCPDLGHRFKMVWHYVDTITHLHPWEYSLRNNYAYWLGYRNNSIDWVLPGADWNYQKSTLRIAIKNLWSQNKCDIVLRKLARNGITELEGTNSNRPIILLKLFDEEIAKEEPNPPIYFTSLFSHD